MPAQQSASTADADARATMLTTSANQPRSATFAGARSVSRQMTANTITVQNCNDSGSGSLRAAVAGASSGDIIDMSGLSCNVICLTSPITTYSNSLTLRGRQASTSTLSPRPILDGQDNVQVLDHRGNDTLTLTSVGVKRGRHITRSCISSRFGTVKLVKSLVHNCNAVCTSGCNVAGTQYGAAVAKTVILDGSTVRDNSALWDLEGQGGIARVAGAGIHSDADTIIKDATASGDSAQGMGGASDTRGGGIFVGGQLSLLNNTLSGNEAVQGAGHAKGGGAYATTSSIVNTSDVIDNTGDGLYLADGGQIKYSIIANNTDARPGGGVFANGDISVEGSTIAGNHSKASGGGLYANSGADIDRTTISDNVSDGTAGAYIRGLAGSPIVMVQSTISGNQSSNSDRGSGLFLGYDAIIKNSTITNNVERNDDDSRHGAGIALAEGAAVDLSSTIVPANMLQRTNHSIESSDIGHASTATSGTVLGMHNLVGYSTLQLRADTIHNEDPMLRPLKDNGGPTWTRRPLNGSPAIDTGLANGFTWDQRGNGFARVAGVAADIGSVDADRIFANGFEWLPHL